MGYSNDEEIQYIAIDILPEQYIINNTDDNLNDIERDEHRNEDEIHEAMIVNYKHYIGIPLFVDHNILLGCFVTAKTLFKYTNQIICSYLYDWSSSANSYLRYGSPEIMQLYITHDRLNSGQIYDIYTVVLKTHWIKIVQRKWRCVYAERKAKLHVLQTMLQMNLININQMDMCDRNGMLPSIRGMLHKLHH